MEIIVHLSISKEELCKYYAGTAKQVSAVAQDGRKVSFPANILQSYVSHQGIRGSFRITYDDIGKFQSIEQLG